jgi:hypothetical protein
MVKQLRDVLHNAGFYLDFIHECMKLVDLVRDKDFYHAVDVANYIHNKFSKGE